MQRTLLCTAALMACGAANAQTSSVQAYGLIDLGYGRFTGANTGVNATNVGVAQLTNGNLSTSHFGFRGSEDLGGGLSASFDLSSFMRADTGQPGRNDAIGAPVNVGADPFFSRQAWVGIGSATLGRLRLGNSTTQLFLNSITSNAFGDSTYFSPLVLVTHIGGPLSGGTSWTNQLIYDLPKLGGLGGSVAYSMSENQGGHNAAVRVFWSTGPAALSFALQSVNKNPSTFADGTSVANTRSWQLAGSYDFGTIKLWSHLGRIENKGTESAPLNIGYRIWDLSAAIPVGVGKVLAGYAVRKTSDAVGPVPASVPGGTVERKVFSVGYDHDLSKRTDLYAMLTNDKTATNTLPAPPKAVTASGSSWALGVRHRF